MIRRPPRSTRTDTLVPYTTLCRSFESKRAVELFECDEREFDLPPCHDVRSPRVRQTLARLAEEVREPGFGHDILIESVALSLVIERSEEHTSELQSLMRISYAVFCLKNKKNIHITPTPVRTT